MFDKLLQAMKPSKGTIDLTLGADYASMSKILSLVETTSSEEKVSPSQFSEALLQSKIVRMVKMEKKVTHGELTKYLKSTLGQEVDSEALKEALRRLVDTQLISVNDTGIEYLP